MRSSKRAYEKRAAWTALSSNEETRRKEGSGNIFLDIGFPPEEAAMLLTKSKLILMLELTIEERKWSQRQVAKIIKTDQASISKLLSGHSMSVSIDQLIKWLTLLGYSVEIDVRPAAGASIKRAP